MMAAAVPPLPCGNLPVLGEAHQGTLNRQVMPIRGARHKALARVTISPHSCNNPASFCVQAEQSLRQLLLLLLLMMMMMMMMMAFT